MKCFERSLGSVGGRRRPESVLLQLDNVFVAAAPSGAVWPAVRRQWRHGLNASRDCQLRDDAREKAPEREARRL